MASSIFSAPPGEHVSDWPKRSLSHNVSVYLDLLRLAAAFAVFLGHANLFFFPDLRYMGFILGHAREAVAVFFVLSGFVIRFVVIEKEGDWAKYLVARLARIYSVAILAVILTFLVDKIGMRYNPSYYESAKFYAPASLESAFRYLTFTNQIWFTHIIFGTNEPYWSLGFEVWYYVLFGLVVFLPTYYKLPAIALWLCVCGPRIALYLPLWLLGVAAYDYYSSSYWKPKRIVSLLLFITTIVFYFAWRHYAAKPVSNMYLPQELHQEIINFIYFVIVGLILCCNILLFDKIAGSTPFWSASLERWVKWGAGASFTLYLVHEPIFALISSMFPSVKTSAPMGVGACMITLILVFLTAELGERRKKMFAHAFWWLKNFLSTEYRRFAP